MSFAHPTESFNIRERIYCRRQKVYKKARRTAMDRSNIDSSWNREKTGIKGEGNTRK